MRARRIAFAVAGSVAWSACAVLAPRPDPSRFFMLTPLAAADANASSSRPLSLGVGPVTLPRYLDRPEMMTRIGANEIRPAAFDYWAGSLQRQFENTLAQDLQILLGARQVQIYPWYPGVPVDAAVEVDVREFERQSDGQVHLSARWRIRNGTGAVVRAGNATIARPVGAEDPGATAAALSELLADFARELAERMR